MKTLFKRNRNALVLAVLMVMGIGIAVAQGPKYAPATLYSYTGGTAVICAGSAATNVNVVIDCASQASVAVQLTSQLKTAGTATINYYFQRSVDGVTYEFPAGTMSGQIVGVAATGVTPVTVLTNLPTFGCGYMRLAWVTNAAAAGADITNMSAIYGVKISSP